MRVVSSEVKVEARNDLPTTKECGDLHSRQEHGKLVDERLEPEDVNERLEDDGSLKDDEILENDEDEDEIMSDGDVSPEDDSEVLDDGDGTTEEEDEVVENEDERQDNEADNEELSDDECPRSDTETSNTVEKNKASLVNSLGQHRLGEKDETNAEIKRVGRGVSCHEKLVQCKNCKKIYRSSNLARHRRSCKQSTGSRIQSDIKEESEDMLDSMESESLEETVETVDVSSKTETTKGGRSDTDLLYVETKRQNRRKQSPLKIKLFGLRSKTKLSTKGSSVSEKKVRKKSKHDFSETLSTEGTEKELVKDDPDNSEAEVNVMPKVQKERPRNKVCEYCQKTFSRVKQLQEHIRTHTGEKPYQCALCGSTFATEKTLDQHMKVHTGEKPYKCNVCGHACSQLGNLQRHMRSHTNERPFLCTQCGFAFKEKNHLDGHVRIHTGERPYECKECHRRFSVSSSLSCHMRTHTGVKPVSCEYCGKKFARRTSLNEHIGKHLGVKMECPECGAIFSHRRSLLSHMNIHEAPKFACSVCGKSFSRKRNMTRHLEMHERRKQKKASLSDGLISNSADIPLSLNTQLKEQGEVRNFQPEHIPALNLQASRTSDDLAVNMYGVSRYLNTLLYSQADTKEYDNAAHGQDDTHADSLLAQFEQEDRDSNNVYKRSAFLAPEGTFTDNVNTIDQANTGKPREMKSKEVAFSNNKQDSTVYKNLSETVVKAELDIEKKADMINEQNKAGGGFDNQRECVKKIYTDEFETVENSSDNSLIVDGTEEDDKEKSEKMIIVKQETVDEDEEYGLMSELVGSQTFMKDIEGHSYDIKEGSLECESDRLNKTDMEKMTEHKPGSVIESINNVIVKVENEDNSSSDNTVIMEPNVLVEELKQSHEKEKKFACLYCTKKFSKSLKLKDHVRTHTGERPYQCEFCGSAFATVHTLKVHKRIHTGVKPYACNVCGHAFTQLANLQSHLRTHSNERPYLCPQCGFAFKEKAHLDGHMFLHTGEKPFECSMCDKRFPSKSALNLHKKIHLGIKPYPCQYCEKCFYRPYQLEEHLRTHTGNKISCQICKHQFTHMSSFRTHMRLHEEGQKYECSKCGKKFSRKRNLKRHTEMKIKPCT